MTGQRLRLPAVDYSEEAGYPVSDKISLVIEAPDLCPRYTARFVEGVSIAPSPWWMQRRLTAIGLRPINNVVDITNYVLHECGQPLHAFDYTDLAGQSIRVRRAQPGETITTLDGEEHELDEDSLLISDAERGVALAGIMGGENSEINPDTSLVLLESAMFNPSNIRRTSRRLGLSTDSSYRFERGVDWDMVDFASRRAISLILQLAGGNAAAGVVDEQCTSPRSHTITARFQRINDLIGVDIPREKTTAYLEGLGLTILEKDEEKLVLRPPTWRHDLEREADIIEEVARLYGLNHVPTVPVQAVWGGDQDMDNVLPLQRIRDAMLALGLDECVHVAPVSEQEIRDVFGSVEGCVKISNPLSREYEYLRPSAISSILKTVGLNIARNISTINIFEIARVFRTGTDGQYHEHYECAIAMTGARHPELYGEDARQQLDFFDLKGVIESLATALRVPTPICRRGDSPLASGIIDSEEWAEIWLDGACIGYIGRVQSRISRKMRATAPIFIAVIDLSPFISCQFPPVRYTPVSPYPPTSRDMAILAPESMEHATILQAIRESGVKHIESVSLFDIYRDPEVLGPDRKSMAYSVTYRAFDRTLTDEEVNALHEQLRNGLINKLQIQFR
ncbi:MAG: phenylalanine--tRNA ligase subunit beta [Lentisphaerae bacterium]|nr:MAG: phenylalanine--tRNA ligase subunit beta [Lentisphaerota bacterium]